MGQISKHIFFKAPLENVWKVWTDVEKTPEWVDGVKESTVTSATKYGPGLSWDEKCFFSGKLIDVSHKIVVWEEKKKTVIRTGLPMGGSMQRIVEFRPASGGTEANVEIEWDLGIVASFFGEEQLAELMDKNFERTGENWKKKAENV